MSPTSLIMLPQITSTEYEQRFDDPSFLVDAVRGICQEMALVGEPERAVTGSNLVFRVRDLWLKLYPSFYRDELTTEAWMLAHVDNRLTVPTPKVVARGERDGWGWLVLSHIDGVPFDVAAKEMSAEDTVRIARELGTALAALHTLPVEGFERPELNWRPYLERALSTVRERVNASGAGEQWGALAEEWIARYRDELLATPAASLVHADLYHDHLLMHRAGSQWSIAGIIDFADTMIAPREYELVDTLLFLFRGRREAQVAMIEASGIAPDSINRELARRVMAWTLVHRFARFGSWFRREIADGAGSIEEIVARTMPL